MLESRGHANLALKPLGAEDVCQVRGQHLQHYAAAERDLLREEDATHAATAEFAVDAIGAVELGAQVF